MPTVVATPTPTPRPTVAPNRPAPGPAPPGGLQKFAEAAFHWPFPLVYEIIFVLLAAYVFVRKDGKWSQQAYMKVFNTA